MCGSGTTTWIDIVFSQQILSRSVKTADNIARSAVTALCEGRKAGGLIQKSTYRHAGTCWMRSFAALADSFILVRTSQTNSMAPGCIEVNVPPAFDIIWPHVQLYFTTFLRTVSAHFSQRPKSVISSTCAHCAHTFSMIPDQHQFPIMKYRFSKKQPNRTNRSEQEHKGEFMNEYQTRVETNKI